MRLVTAFSLCRVLDATYHRAHASSKRHWYSKNPFQRLTHCGRLDSWASSHLQSVNEFFENEKASEKSETTMTLQKRVSLTVEKTLKGAILRADMKIGLHIAVYEGFTAEMRNKSSILETSKTCKKYKVVSNTETGSNQIIKQKITQLKTRLTHSTRLHLLLGHHTDLWRKQQHRMCNRAPCRSWSYC